jgi:Tol biopolymer transport system component
MGGKGGIKPLATSAGGKKLLFAARDGACYVYDPATGREDPVKGAPARMGCPRFSPDGKGIYFVRFDCLLYAPVEER